MAKPLAVSSQADAASGAMASSTVPGRADSPESERHLGREGSVSASRPETAASDAEEFHHADDSPLPETDRGNASLSLEDLMQFQRRESVALIILTTLALLYTAYTSRVILMPITFAALVALTLRPVVRRLKRMHIPEPIGAGITLFVILAIAGLAVTNLVEPARAWADQAPQIIETVRAKMNALQGQWKELAETSTKVQELASGEGAVQPVQVQIAPSRFSTNIAVLSNTGNLLASIFLVLCLAYFLLSWGDRLLNNTLRLLNSFSDKKRTVELVYDVERGVASYLLTVTIINVLLGGAVGIAMWLLGVPNAFLWGAMTTVLNYIPILGAIATFAIIALVSLISFDSMLYAMVPPAVFCLLAAVEGNVITPSILGKSMSLNPILVFVSLIFWGWIWGVGGAFLAVPLLAMAKIACDRFEKTKPIAVLMET